MSGIDATWQISLRWGLGSGSRIVLRNVDFEEGGLGALRHKCGGTNGLSAGGILAIAGKLLQRPSAEGTGGLGVLYSRRLCALANPKADER